jgi:hypothetical protein
VTNVTDGVNGHNGNIGLNDNNNIGLNGINGNIGNGGRHDYHGTNGYTGTNGLNEHRTLKEMEMGSPRTEDEHRELIDSTAYARDSHLPVGSKPAFPNPLTKVRFWGKEYFAEFLVSSGVFAARLVVLILQNSTGDHDLLDFRLCRWRSIDSGHK